MKQAFIEVIKKIAKLIDLKSIITLAITGFLMYGFVVKVISAEQFMTVATMILTYYFAKKDKKEEEEIKQENPNDKAVG